MFGNLVPCPSLRPLGFYHPPTTCQGPDLAGVTTVGKTLATSICTPALYAIEGYYESSGCCRGCDSEGKGSPRVSQLPLVPQEWDAWVQ